MFRPYNSKGPSANIFACCIQLRTQVRFEPSYAVSRVLCLSFRILSFSPLSRRFVYFSLYSLHFFFSILVRMYMYQPPVDTIIVQCLLFFSRVENVFLCTSSLQKTKTKMCLLIRENSSQNARCSLSTLLLVLKLLKERKKCRIVVFIPLLFL